MQHQYQGQQQQQQQGLPVANLHHHQQQQQQQQQQQPLAFGQQQQQQQQHQPITLGQRFLHGSSTSPSIASNNNNLNSNINPSNSLLLSPQTISFGLGLNNSNSPTSPANFSQPSLHHSAHSSSSSINMLHRTSSPSFTNTNSLINLNNQQQMMSAINNNSSMQFHQMPQQSSRNLLQQQADSTTSRLLNAGIGLGQQLGREGGKSKTATQMEIPQKAMFSESGFDVVSLLVKMATRPNPKIALGPIDLSCAFVVSDLRLYDNPIVYVSPTFESMTGFSAEDIIGKNCRFLQHPTQDVPIGTPRSYTDHSIVCNMKKCVMERIEGQFTLVNYKKNGEPFLNHVTMIPLRLDDSKEYTHIIGLQIDLIQQPKAIMNRMKNGTYLVNYHQESIPKLSDVSAAEEASNAELLQSISKPITPIHLSFMKKVPDFIHVLSLRGLVLHVSPESCKRLLEWDAEEMVGHKISDFVHPSDLVTVMRDLRNCSSEGSVNFICRMKRKKSGFVYMEMNGHVYSGSKRNRCFIIAGREKPVLTLLHKSFLRPDPTPENETWLKISPEGLILFASASATFFFSENIADVLATSIFDWVDSNEHFSLSHALNSSSDETTSVTMHLRGVSLFCKFRFLHIGDTLGGMKWVQVKRQTSANDGYQSFMLSDENVYNVIQSVRSSSIYYECNKIRVRNAALSAAIEQILEQPRI